MTRRWKVRAVVVAVVFAGVAIGLTMVGGASAAAYRVQRAGIGDVTEDVTAPGTVEASNQADANFGASGTVASVYVAVGDHVSAGQSLAELDTTNLQAAVQQAQANLAVAQAQLANAESATTSTPSPDSCPSGGSATSGGSGPQSSGQSANASPGPQNGSPSSGGQGPSSGSGPAPSTSTTTEPTTTTLPAPSVPTPGTSSTQTTEPSQEHPARARSTEISGHFQLTAAVTSGSNCPGANSGGGGANGSGPRGAGGSSNPHSQVYQDEVSVYQAQGDLDTAEQNLAAANLKAPISGTVYQVAVAPGDQVSSGVSGALSPTSVAGSSSSGSSAAIVIVDTGGYEVVCDVSSADIAEMRYGDSAVITLASAGRVSGVVTSIGVTPSSSNGITTFPVVVTVTGAHGALYTGTNAEVEIVVAHHEDVLSVPTSAVQTNGRTASVSLLVNGHLVHRVVHVGVVGPMRTQIISGLAAGQEVVLANENQPIPNPGSNSPGGPGGAISIQGGFPGGAEFVGGG